MFVCYRFDIQPVYAEDGEDEDPKLMEWGNIDQKEDEEEESDEDEDDDSDDDDDEEESDEEEEGI